MSHLCYLVSLCHFANHRSQRSQKSILTFLIVQTVIFTFQDEERKKKEKERKKKGCEPIQKSFQLFVEPIERMEY